tara:strand:+ start:110 stop:544 length:435 start_codon:yes stop_codon:yes gene_type:complete
MEVIMKVSIFGVLLSGSLFMCSHAFAEYSGKGGMAAYDISSEVYEYHYKHGFTGEDAMGWDPNLQYAWSRVGAAMTCNVDMDKALVLKGLSNEFGNDPFIHDMNGVGFHHMQSKNIEGFCSPERVDEIKDLIPNMEAGEFPEKF